MQIYNITFKQVKRRPGFCFASQQHLNRLSAWKASQTLLDTTHCIVSAIVLQLPRHREGAMYV